jgi:hypothetical protein
MEIVPYRSVGSLKLHMTSEEISTQLKEDPKRFRKHDEEMLSDHYVKAGILVYYRTDGRCDSIELTDDKDPVIDGIHFMKMPAKKAKKLLLELDEEMIDLEDMAISRKLGISLYIPYNKVETVMIFEKGYYDEMLKLLEEMDAEI